MLLPQSAQLIYFLHHMAGLLKTAYPFRHFLAVLSLPTLYKVETRKTFGTHSSNIVCGVRGGVDLCALQNAPETQKCTKTFVHDCSIGFR